MRVAGTVIVVVVMAPETHWSRESSVLVGYVWVFVTVEKMTERVGVVSLRRTLVETESEGVVTLSRVVVRSEVAGLMVWVETFVLRVVVRVSLKVEVVIG